MRVNTESEIWVQSEYGSWNLTPPGSSSSSSPSERGISPSLSISIEEQASCYFAANFILLPLADNHSGHLNFVLPLIAGEPARSPAACLSGLCVCCLWGNKEGGRDRFSGHL